MTVSLASPSDIINDALRRIGYKLRVSSLFDGSEAAAASLDIYGQTRDTLLRDGEWLFCQRDVVGTLLKQAPANGYIPPTVWDGATNPPYPWKFSYEYPGDCLKVRIVKEQSLFLFQPDPQPTLFQLVNDNGGAAPVQVICANVENPMITYTGRVTDPTQFPVDFTEALCAALGRRLVPTLVGMNAVQLAGQDESVSLKLAESEQG